jgi:hypothetical protein
LTLSEIMSKACWLVQPDRARRGFGSGTLD